MSRNPSANGREQAVNLTSRRQISELQNRLAEAEETLDAIRNGAVDALVVRTPRGEQLFTLKGADQTYRVLVEGMNEGAVTIKRGIISYCNNRFSEMVGVPMEKIFGASVYDFILAPRLSSLIHRLEKGRQQPGLLEGELRRPNGGRIPVILSFSRFSSEGSPMVSVVLTDIAERLRAEKALAESERRFKEVARTSSDAIWDWDLKQGRVWRSEGFEKLFGYPADKVEPTLRWWQSRVHPEDRERVLQAQREALSNGANSYELTYRFRRADGSYAHVSDRGSVQRDGQRTPARVIGALRDITQRIEAQLARQELSRSIINAQEQERQRVARDLHDSVNQLLASGVYRLGVFAARQHGSEGGFNSALQIRDMIGKALNEVRFISRNLRPSELDDLGLVAALRSLAHEFGERTGIRTSFSHKRTDCPALTKEAEMAVYRIAQEALNNVEKHSKATRADLGLKCPRGSVVLVVKDNGNGFNPGISRGSGWGLKNISERAHLEGGHVEIQSAPGKGTIIKAHIPVVRRPMERPVI